MANGLTNLIPDLYVALDVVSRELNGLIPSVMMDADVAQAAVGQSVYSHVAPAATAQDITPSVTSPDTGDQTIGNVELTIQKSRMVPIRWNGEQTRAVNNGGHGVMSIKQNQIAQAIRTLMNEVEIDLAGLHATFSRAYGSAGTTPFNTAGDYTDASETMRILDDNGAPVFDRQLVVNTAAGAKIRGKQASVDNDGDVMLQRQGVFHDISGAAVRQSGQIITSTAGTGSSATTDNAGYAVGDTVITLASAGTGTIVAGDVITFAGDSNQYVVASGDDDVSNGGTITLAANGLRQAIAASTTAITVVAAAARNMAFARSALILATRMPALPEEGDMADDREIIIDPRTGIAFELALYKQHRQNQYQIGLAWGVKNVKPEHTALLLG